MVSYDVIVVGSGAAGGTVAHDLANAGTSVLMLEAGRDYDPTVETPMFQRLQDAPLRGRPTEDKPAGFYDATIDGGWQITGEPYEVAEGSDPFQWW
ncbi:MAG: GMC family oxidoreductase [Erythrobacter sp.]|uniref:FAD-binding protein n=1 Tax=Erythrobacter sp. TaxID=1042 RepID=UPI001B2BE550|nr:FAD-binding protein [Erythrobacter sp.]MBO6697127.1 GMC family oxidoreductase [Henriciella sp.]MBO6769733.1 GMC family oxidoreductase [Erythrobacter sp.]